MKGVEPNTEGHYEVERDLRKRALSVLAELPASPSLPLDQDFESINEMNVALIHELQVHQIELELQNQELRRVNEELERSEGRYSDLYVHAPVGYLTLTKDGRITDANLAVASLLQAPREQLLDQELFVFLCPKSQDTLHIHMRQVLKSRQIHGCELTVRPTMGRERSVQLKSVTCDENGEARCRVVVIDITERKKTERDNHELEQQLVQVHKMEALGRIAGGIAHDFNNLLTLIIGYSKFVINSLDETDALFQPVMQIHKAGNHAAEFIDQLVSFSRHHTIRPTLVDLNALIRDLHTTLQGLTREDVEFVTKLGITLGAVRVDASQLNQVLLNLVVNANEAMPQGGQLIIETDTVSLTPALAYSFKLDPGDYVRLQVSDTGHGMDEETKARIFEPFFSTKGTAGGNTGFGLATTYGIITQSGGAIRVDSEVDHGTTFTIYLPQFDEEATHPRTTPVDATASQQKETILVVEDQPDLLNYAILVLQKYGYHVLSASHPAEALAITSRHKGEIDLIVTDVTMPDMNGCQLVEHLLGTYPNLKVLFISGHSRDTVSEDYDFPPHAGFLEKPFTPEGLGHRVKEALSKEDDSASTSGG